MLLVSVDGASGPGADREWTCSVPAEQGHGRTLRADVREWLLSLGSDAGRIDDVLLVLSELFSNAVRATVGQANVSVTVTVTPQAGSLDEVTVAVANVGKAFELSSLKPPAPDREGGRGLAIASSLGSVRVLRNSKRTVVECALDGPGPDPRR